MKIVPGLWPERRKAPKIGRRLEPAIWLLAAVLAVALTLSVSSPARAAGAKSPPPAIQAPTLQPELAVSSYRRACLRRVIDLTKGQSEAQIVDQLNRRCFRLQPTSRRVAPPTRCVEAFIWVPGLGTLRRPGSCFRQSRAGSRPQ